MYPAQNLPTKMQALYYWTCLQASRCCIHDLESALHFLESSKTEIALLGDFNIDMKSSTKTKGQQQELHSFLVVNDLKQITETPTRVCQFSSTLIDLICVNNYHRVVQKKIIATPISDHNIFLCVFKSGIPKLLACTYMFKSRSFRNYKMNSETI